MAVTHQLLSNRPYTHRHTGIHGGLPDQAAAPPAQESESPVAEYHKGKWLPLIHLEKSLEKSTLGPSELSCMRLGPTHCMGFLWSQEEPRASNGFLFGRSSQAWFQHPTDKYSNTSF